MSRVGRKPIPVPAGVRVEITDGTFVVEGPKGRLAQPLLPGYPVTVEGGEVKVARTGESGPDRAKHGLLRALLANAVQGVSTGFTRALEINCVGYKAELRDGGAGCKEILFALGYSHPVLYKVPAVIEIEIEKNTKLTVSGVDRQAVGQVAAEIRRLRPPDPYKAKGIKYADEILRRKVGKAGAK